MPHKEQGSMRVTTQTAAGIVPEGDLSDNRGWPELSGTRAYWSRRCRPNQARMTKLTSPSAQKAGDSPPTGSNCQ
jgi:hypothetical protein